MFLVLNRARFKQISFSAFDVFTSEINISISNTKLKITFRFEKSIIVQNKKFLICRTASVTVLLWVYLYFFFILINYSNKNPNVLFNYKLNAVWLIVYRSWLINRVKTYSSASIFYINKPSFQISNVKNIAYITQW